MKTYTIERFNAGRSLYAAHTIKAYDNGFMVRLDTSYEWPITTRIISELEAQGFERAAP